VNKVCVVQNGRWRVVEADGSLCRCWLPGEDREPLGLDKGGFDHEMDAVAFALGVNWERCYRGLLPGLTTEDIDEVRRKLDSGRGRSTRSILAEIRRLGGMLDLAG
jgi:hypothetical protein